MPTHEFPSQAVGCVVVMMIVIMMVMKGLISRCEHLVGADPSIVSFAIAN